MDVRELKILPAKSIPVAKLIGVENTLKLLIACAERNKKMQYVYIPKKLGKREHRLERIIGREALLRLIEVYGGEQVWLSSKNEWLKSYKVGCILELKALGFSIKEITGFFRISKQYVGRITRYGR